MAKLIVYVSVPSKMRGRTRYIPAHKLKEHDREPLVLCLMRVGTKIVPSAGPYCAVEFLPPPSPHWRHR